MARINLVDENSAPEEIVHFYAQGNPGPIPTSLAHVPDLMSTALPFIGRVLGPSSIIDLRTKEIVILRASHLQRCRYCTQTHTVMALEAGLTPAEVTALRGEGNLDEAFPSLESQALIAWTDAVATGPSGIGEGPHELLTHHYDERQIVELTMVAAATIMLNRYATALDLPVAEPHRAMLAEHGW